MPKRESFLMRLDPEVLNALRRWADDELRSVNGQLEFLLRKSLKDAGRSIKAPADGDSQNNAHDEPTPSSAPKKRKKKKG